MGCGASADQPQSKAKKYEPNPETELGGKHKYLGDYGAAVMSQEDKKTGGNRTLLAYIDKQNGATSFTLHVSKTKNLFSLALSDEEFQKQREQNRVLLAFPAIYKSITSDLQKGKVKITMLESSVTIEFTITTAKDPNNKQPMALSLYPLDSSGANAVLHLLEPLARMVQCNRVAAVSGEDQEKEMRISRLQNRSKVLDANILAYRNTVDRMKPEIVPLREEATRYSKSSAELISKIAKLERKLRRAAKASGKPPLDGLYEDGGARPFQHIPHAEEHIPQEEDFSQRPILDYLQLAMPNATDAASINTLMTSPSDPAIAKMLDVNRDEATKVMKVFQRIDDWDMNVFQLEQATNNTALFHVTYAILYKLNLINDLKIDDKILRNFLSAVQAGYHPNPYHNATHAADVAQINYFIMTKGGLVSKLKMSKEELFAGVLAGAIHDYDHPGFNNLFHTRTSGFLATLYNERSILENHHLACVFEMMRQPKYNILANMTDAQYREVRDTMVEMVLATDMGQHGRIFSTFRKRLNESPEWHVSKEDSRLALSMSIKMADISNCGRPKSLYLEWAKNIAAEFYMQGDVEQQLCLPVSPFMDRRRDKEDFPKGQISFMNYVVVPMFEAISEFLPPVEVALEHCAENKAYWQALE